MLAWFGQRACNLHAVMCMLCASAIIKGWYQSQHFIVLLCIPCGFLELCVFCVRKQQSKDGTKVNIGLCCYALIMAFWIFCQLGTDTHKHASSCS